MNQKQMDRLDKIRKELRKDLRDGYKTPEEAFQSLKSIGYSSERAVIVVNTFCIATSYRDDFTADELENM